MNRIAATLWMIGLLILTTLACAQAGEILTPEEATRRAEEDRSSQSSGGSGGAIGATFAPGDSATIVGDDFLVNVRAEPGGRISAGLQRGTDVTVVDSAVTDNELWYNVESSIGDGWLQAKYLGSVEGEGQETTTGGETVDAGAFSPGDTGYLTAQYVLVNLYREPGGIILAVEDRGEEAEVLEVTAHEGKNWYLVRVGAGDGWVPEEGLTADPP